MNLDSKIFVAGHTGLVGSAIHRKLISEGFNNIITASIDELNLINQADTLNFLRVINRSMFFLRLLKLVEFLPIIPFLHSLFMIML